MLLGGADVSTLGEGGGIARDDEVALESVPVLLVLWAKAGSEPDDEDTCSEV